MDTDFGTVRRAPSELAPEQKSGQAKPKRPRRKAAASDGAGSDGEGNKRRRRRRRRLKKKEVKAQENYGTVGSMVSVASAMSHMMLVSPSVDSSVVGGLGAQGVDAALPEMLRGQVFFDWKPAAGCDDELVLTAGAFVSIVRFEGREREREREADSVL